jgi:hypothetical protein
MIIAFGVSAIEAARGSTRCGAAAWPLNRESEIKREVAVMASSLFIRSAGKTGLGLYGLSAVFAFIAIGAVVYLRSNQGAAQSFTAFAVWFGALVLMQVIYKFARRARVKIFPSYEALEQYIAQRGERLFVFLREFTSDAVKDVTSSARFFVSQEDKIANHFQQYGTVVAIGEPGERLPAGDCFRLYLDHNIWQPVVSRLIEQADLVLLRCGDKPGLSWELEQVITRKLEGTLFIPSQDAQKNAVALDRLRKVITSHPTELDISTNKTVELGKQALAENVLLEELRNSAEAEKFRKNAQEMIESLPRMNEAFKSIGQAVAFLAPLVRVKDGALVPVEGELSKALDEVTNALHLRRKPWTTLKLWAIVVITFGGPAILFAGHFLCGSSGCGVLDQYLVYAFMSFAVMIVFFGFFTINE